MNEIDTPNTEFNLWAFGREEVYFSRYGSNFLDIMDMWNKRHSGLLELKPEDNIYSSLEKMWKLWEKSKNKEVSK